jgi:NADP-dependent 3-hydroxy acid dehydrogenase YdfG
MKKLEGKVAVITAATSGMALATAKLFVEEGAYVFITGRREDKLDEAVKLIGKNVTGVQGDAANLADLDRLYDTSQA